MAKVKIGSRIVETQAGETLLESLERQGYTIEYQCRSGYCGSCRVRLLRGKVRYIRSVLAFAQSPEIFPCSCVPDGDVEIDVL